MGAKQKKESGSSKASPAQVPRIPVTNVISMRGHCKAVNTPAMRTLRHQELTKLRPKEVRYEPVVDDREQGYRIVSVVEAKRFIVTYWLDGVLQSRTIEATAKEEAALILDREMEERDKGNG